MASASNPTVVAAGTGSNDHTPSVTPSLGSRWSPQPNGAAAPPSNTLQTPTNATQQAGGGAPPSFVPLGVGQPNTNGVSPLNVSEGYDEWDLRLRQSARPHSGTGEGRGIGERTNSNVASPSQVAPGGLTASAPATTTTTTTTTNTGRIVSQTPPSRFGPNVAVSPVHLTPDQGSPAVYSEQSGGFPPSAASVVTTTVHTAVPAPHDPREVRQVKEQIAHLVLQLDGQPNSRPLSDEELDGIITNFALWNRANATANAAANAHTTTSLPALRPSYPPASAAAMVGASGYPLRPEPNRWADAHRPTDSSRPLTIDSELKWSQDHGTPASQQASHLLDGTPIQPTPVPTATTASGATTQQPASATSAGAQQQQQRHHHQMRPSAPIDRQYLSSSAAAAAAQRGQSSSSVHTATPQQQGAGSPREILQQSPAMPLSSGAATARAMRQPGPAIISTHQPTAAALHAAQLHNAASQQYGSAAPVAANAPQQQSSGSRSVRSTASGALVRPNPSRVIDQEKMAQIAKTVRLNPIKRTGSTVTPSERSAFSARSTHSNLSYDEAGSNHHYQQAPPPPQHYQPQQHHRSRAEAGPRFGNKHGPSFN